MLIDIKIFQIKLIPNINIIFDLIIFSLNIFFNQTIDFYNYFILYLKKNLIRALETSGSYPFI